MLSAFAVTLSGTIAAVTGDRQLRWTFDTAAGIYDAARPEYPPELYDDLVAQTQLTPGTELLEIGCASGKATRPLLERGFSVLCVELGEQLAERASRNLGGLPFSVEVSAFETWTPPARRFELVYAATAWHWLDPAVAYPAAHSVLKPGGHLAFWAAEHAFPEDFDPFFAEIQDVYDEIGESREGEWPPARPEDVPDASAEIGESGVFDTVAITRYVWERRYTAEEYIALLTTFSGHIAMAPDKRGYLFEQVRERVRRRPDGRIRRHWLAVLHVARRRGS